MSNLKKFQALLCENGYDAAIITDQLNQQYLSGFEFHDGVVLVMQKDAYLITDFRYEGQRITNYEMEGSAIAGLSLLMGHKAMTVCCVIAQRKVEAANTDYKPRIKQLVQTVLERI